MWDPLPTSTSLGHVGIGVVVVVPTFTIGKECCPPEIAGVIRRIEAAVAPFVGHGVDKPSAVPEEDRPHKHPPQQP